MEPFSMPHSEGAQGDCDDTLLRGSRGCEIHDKRTESLLFTRVRHLRPSYPTNSVFIFPRLPQYSYPRENHYSSRTSKHIFFLQ